MAELINTGIPAVHSDGGWAVPGTQPAFAMPQVNGRIDLARADVLAQDLDASVTAHGMLDLDFLLARGWKKEELESLLPGGLRKLAEMRSERLMQGPLCGNKAEMVVLDEHGPSTGTVAAGLAAFAMMTLGAIGWALAMISDLTVPMV